MKKIIIFGGSGDLSKRKIMPALSKIIKDNTKVYAYARSDLSEVFSSNLREFYEYENVFPEKVIYIKGEYDDLSPLTHILDPETIVYLSLPPHVISVVLTGLSKLDFGLICIEKPFGNTIQEFRELEKYKNPKIKFIDHYLLKPLLMASSSIQKSQPELFEFLNNKNIRSVECLFTEIILAEGRVYFDKSGIIKDVMQNHLIEMIATILCPKPHYDYSRERLEFIKQMIMDDKEYVFGQYESYKEEIKYDSNTETFAAFLCYVNSEEWLNIPFLMVAGKGLDRKSSEIVFNIRRDSFVSFVNLVKKIIPNPEIPDSNSIDEMSLNFNVAPDCEIYFTFKCKNKDTVKMILINSQEIKKSLNTITEFQSDYEELFASLIADSYIPTISFEEAEELWRLFENIVAAEKKLIYYPVGIKRPKDAIKMLEKHL